jgi:hypothetical protein
LEAELDVGIDDKLWAKDDKKQRAQQPVEESVELTETELKTGEITLFDERDSKAGDE